MVEGREKLTGDPSAILGTYEAKTKKIDINKEAVSEWMKKGAQPTESIRKLLGL